MLALALRFAAGLVLALLFHLFAVRLPPDGLAAVVDPFLLFIVFRALDGGVLGAALGGCVAGLAEDAVSNGLFGLYGLAGTVVGYAAARAVQFLSIERRSFVALLFSLSAVLQQIVVLILTVVLVAERELPSLGILALRILFAGLLGVLLVTTVSKVSQRFRVWRRDRQPRIRWGVRE